MRQSGLVSAVGQTNYRIVSESARKASVETEKTIGNKLTSKTPANALSDAVTMSDSLKEKLASLKASEESSPAGAQAPAASRDSQTMIESRIRDTDLQQEMHDYLNSNILNQAATAMLAQAPMQTAGVLRFLR